MVCILHGIHSLGHMIVQYVGVCLRVLLLLHQLFQVLNISMFQSNERKIRGGMKFDTAAVHTQCDRRMAHITLVLTDRPQTFPTRIARRIGTVI